MHHTPPLPRVVVPLLCVLLCGTVLLAAEPAGHSVLTYNIRYLNTRDGADVWPNRAAAVIETIQRADIVGLQEVVAQQLDEIRAGTPEFTWYGVGRDDGRTGGEMTPIGWRTKLFRAESQGTFWLSESPATVGKKGWDAALPRVASWVELVRIEDNHRLLFVNTHFDHMGREARRMSAIQLRTWIAQHRGEGPAILVGDLNAKLEDAPLQALLSAPLADAPPLHDARAVEGIQDAGPDSTWNGFQAITPGQRIDHVLYSGAVQVLGYETLDPRTADDRFASDHLPIQVRVNW